MLKGISPLLSPQLLAALYRMGHGDEVALADAHFPGESLHGNVIRADGLLIPDLLDAILPLFELDSYADHAALMMAPVEGDRADPAVQAGYRKILEHYCPAFTGIGFLGRFAFYERARESFAIVMTGDTTKYGNIILRKGVTP